MRGSSAAGVVRPNNPTGNLLSPERILQVLEETGAVVAVDEALLASAGAAVSLARLAGTEGFERWSGCSTWSGCRTG